MIIHCFVLEFLGHLNFVCHFVVLCVINHVFDFSSETTGQILMNLKKDLIPRGCVVQAQTVSNSSKYSNNFSSESTSHVCQILMKLGHKDHPVLGIRILRRAWPQGALGVGLIMSDCAKSSNNFSSESTVQILINLEK